MFALVSLADAQQLSSSPNATQIARVDATLQLLQKYKDIAALSVPERRSAFRNSSPTDKSGLWKVHLALYLVQSPNLSQGQQRIILDAISLASPELFTINSESTRKTQGDDPLQSLAQRALSAFPKNEAAEVFANIGGGIQEDDLLQKYNQMSVLPMKQRRASFRTASAHDRSDLWKTHLALYLVRRPELNEVQKEVILAAMSLARSQLFEVRSSDPTWNAQVGGPLRSLEGRIVAVFSKEEGAKIFATLGDSDPVQSSLDRTDSGSLTIPDYLPTSDSSPNKQWTQNRFAAQDMELVGGDCVCSTESDWCWNWCGGAGCKRSESGCGTLWAYACNGSSCH